ncbi:unnamed protein product [Ascophyllum nodosum]
MAGGGPTRTFGLDWPQIDRFTAIQDRGVLVVKILQRVTTRETSYVCGVGTDDSEKRWEAMAAQLEALRKIAALTRGHEEKPKNAARGIQRGVCGMASLTV